MALLHSVNTGRIEKDQMQQELQQENFQVFTPYDLADYRPRLDLLQTEAAIKYVKDGFEKKLADALNLQRVSAPMLVLAGTGVNDHLDGVQKPVSFDVKAVEAQAEIVQSLAKWKRLALADYGFEPGEGLYTDMNALRPDEKLDHFHSVYVDQWDWERIITREDRSVLFLKSIVQQIYAVVYEMERIVCEKFPELPEPFLPNEIFFIHSSELQEKYPDLTPKEREYAICREKGAVFVIGIGAELNDGEPHDERAADYDDWITRGENGCPGLNGDILIWYPLLNCAMELSSMGIRVDKESLRKQLKLRNEIAKEHLSFHQHVLNERVPLTIGGGIGQSRLCMALLRKAHVGEVQASIWPQDLINRCKTNGIPIL